MKILLPETAVVTNGDIDLSVLNKYGEVDMFELMSYDEFKEASKDYEAIICNKMPITREIIENAPNLKYIGLFATGYNNIDVEFAAKRGIPVCNAGVYSTDAVAQHVFAFILNHYNGISAQDDFVKKGGWKKSRTFSAFVYPMRELKNKTIGIIGFGSIGQKVAEIARAFSMRVLCNTRTPKKADGVEFCDIETLARESNIISVHCPLTDKTNGMFNKTFFDSCKQGALFINTSRGPVVDEEALAAAIKAEKITAAVDVLFEEPQRKDCPLSDLDGITITPHAAWAAVETRQRLLTIVEDNLKSFLEGNTKNSVNGI